MYNPLCLSLSVISSPFFLSSSVLPFPLHPVRSSSPRFPPFLHAPLIFISHLICEHMRQRNRDAEFCVITNTQQNVSAKRMIAYPLSHPEELARDLEDLKLQEDKTGLFLGSKGLG